MNNLNISHYEVIRPEVEAPLARHSIQSDTADVLAYIYEENINLTTWQRTLSPELISASQQLLASDHTFRISTSVTPEETFEALYGILGANTAAKLISNDIAEIVEMFCCLFDLEQVGLRLTTLDKAMCPKFHVDRVVCRLITTYSGIATEWLPHNVIDRSKLGMGSKGKSDAESGIYHAVSDIQQLNSGDVSLLKGESWIGNEGGGLVHRSPQVTNENKRLVMTLDFA